MDGPTFLKEPYRKVGMSVFCTQAVLGKVSCLGNFTLRKPLIFLSLHKNKGDSHGTDFFRNFIFGISSQINRHFSIIFKIERKEKTLYIKTRSL